MSHLQNCSLKIYLKRALGGRVGRGGGQDGCERRIKVFVKIQKKNWGEGGVLSGRGGVGLGGQGRCDQRSEVFVKIQKKYFWGVSGRGGGGGVTGWM